MGHGYRICQSVAAGTAVGVAVGSGSSHPASGQPCIDFGQSARASPEGDDGRVRTRVSRVQSDQYQQNLDNLYESCLAWSDDFVPNARWEYAGLLAGDIKGQGILSYRAESLAYSTIFMRILAG